MRIVVNDIAASKAGAMTVLKDFYKSVRESGKEHEWIFLLGEKNLEETENIKIVVLSEVKKSKVEKLKFDFITGKKFISSFEPDLVISLQNIITFGLKVPQIVYLHQAIPFQRVKKFSLLRKEEREPAIYQRIIAPIIYKSVKHATRVVVQTEWIRDAACKKTNICPENIVVIRPNVNDLVSFIDDSEFDNTGFIYPTSEMIYKNNECVYNACSILNSSSDADFIVKMTLGTGPEYDHIEYIGTIPYESLVKSYNRNTLVFPSYIESFGYPLIEAKTMGTIVLVSDCPFSHELLGDYPNAYYFDPFKPEQLAELMKKVIAGVIKKETYVPIEYNKKDAWEEFIEYSLKKRLLFITNIPSPYRVDFFNELGKVCDLTVLFERESSAERDKSWERFSAYNFNAVSLSGMRVDTDKSISLDVVKYLKGNKYDAIIVSNPATPTGIIAIEYMKTHHIPYWIEGDGALPRDIHGFKERIKTRLLKGASGYFSTSVMHDMYYRCYGIEDGLIHRYPFTSIKEEDIALTVASTDEKKSLKESLGIKEEFVVVSVGQMIYRKGFDILLEALADLPRKIGVYIIGGKITEELQRIIEKHGLTNVHILDFKSRHDLKLYYRSADIFVLPTREDIWGLVINEAMAEGLPVVTTKKCVAGTELVRDGHNGFLVETEDITGLSETMLYLYQNPSICSQMGKNSLEIIRNYTIEKMAEAHKNCLKL